MVPARLAEGTADLHLDVGVGRGTEVPKTLRLCGIVSAGVLLRVTSGVPD
jgi:hypothetical protein